MKNTILPFILLSLFGVFRLDAQESTALSPIDKIEVSGGILLQIEHTPGYQLRIKTEGLDSSCVIKTIKDRTLTLKIDNSFDCRGKVSASLGCPGLKEIVVEGKAELSAKDLITSDSLILNINSGGQAYIDMDIKYLKAGLAGGGLLKSEGYAVKQDISVSSWATFSGYELEGEKVNVKTSVGGKAKICATEELNASAGSEGYISYKCNPKSKNIDAKPGGTIEEFK